MNKLPPLPKICGILNLSRDSFSDGGLYSSIEEAIAHAQFLAKNGADIIDIGAESSNPMAVEIPVETEIQMLTPVVNALIALQIPIAIDTYKPNVMKAMIELGVKQINDITGLKNPETIAILKSFPDIEYVLMYSIQDSAHAQNQAGDLSRLLFKITDYFIDKLTILKSEHINLSRIILDPGMGFFLGSSPQASLMVLKHLEKFKLFGQKLYLSVSRKSFIGKVLNQEIPNRQIGTAIGEVWAWLHGANYLRTHDPKACLEAIKMWKAINQGESWEG